MIAARRKPSVGYCNGVARRRWRLSQIAPPVVASVLLLTAAVASWFAVADPGPGLSSPQLILVLVVDTLRADHTGVGGYLRPTTPSLDQWAQRGVVFERAWAPSSWTLPSMASIWTGLLPARHGAGARGEDPATFSAISRGVAVLGEEMGRGGWTSVGFVTNRFLHRDYGFARGFSGWDHGESRAWRERRAATIVDRVLDWLDHWDGRKTLLAVHLFDPHMPYDAPPPFRGRFAAGAGASAARLQWENARQVRETLPGLDENSRQQLTAAYDEEIAYVDAQIGRLFDALQARGLFEGSLVILTSDHGEELFDHGGFEHGHAQWEGVLRVPLVVWSRGSAPGRRQDPTSLTDLLPTLLEAAALPVPRGLDGRSLWPIMRGSGRVPGRWLAAQGNLYGDRDQQTVIRWPWKRIVSPGSGRAELFDLESDPGETRDLETVRTVEARQLEAARSDLGLASGRQVNGAAPPINAETAAELRALGYLH